MIVFAHSCMRRLASNSHFNYSFQYHSDHDPQSLKEYWAGRLGIEARIIHPTPKINSGHLECLTKLVRPVARTAEHLSH